MLIFLALVCVGLLVAVGVLLGKNREKQHQIENLGGLLGEAMIDISNLKWELRGAHMCVELLIEEQMRELDNAHAALQLVLEDQANG